MKKVKKIVFNIGFLLVCMVVAYLVSNYMFVSIPIIGSSMETTIHNDDTVILYKLGKYNVGDIVVFDCENIQEHMDKRLIKRIIGMPGDTVEVKLDETDGKYYTWRNGKKLIEDYTNDSSPMQGVMAPITVPEGKFLFMGDNRGVSMDSRSTGVLGDLDTIIGRVIIRYQKEENGRLDVSTVKRGG
jgi:signal peptidase I